jgi:hypothetical protein
MRRLTHTQSHEPTIPLGRITAKLYNVDRRGHVLPPPRLPGRAGDHEGSELRDITRYSVTCLFGVSPTCMLQIDKHLGGLLATPI